MKALLFFLMVFSLVIESNAQTDTVPVPPPRDTSTAAVRTIDTTPVRRPAVTRPAPQPRRIDTTEMQDTSFVPVAPQQQVDTLQQNELPVAIDNFWSRFREYVYSKNALIGFTQDVTKYDSNRKVFKGREPIFYYIIFMLLLFGLLRQAFEKYFTDLFRVFFRTTLKQRQIREQLLQSPLPSVLLNGYFVLSAGLYINFLLQHYDFKLHPNFWMQYLYCIAGLSSIYLVKYLGLQLTGWLFNVKGATDSYTFIVFIINKMLGIFLLPFLVLLAFTEGTVLQIAITLSWVGIGLLLIYRFILSYAAVRKEITLNPFHFILYLLAFEVIPLLLIYKLLLRIF